MRCADYSQINANCMQKWVLHIHYLIKLFESISYQTNRKSSSPYAPEAVIVFAGLDHPNERIGTVLKLTISSWWWSWQLTQILFITSKGEWEDMPFVLGGPSEPVLNTSPQSEMLTLFIELGSWVINNNESNNTPESSCNRI
jgi:hypothetical protein